MTIMVKQYKDGWAVGTEKTAELCNSKKQAYIAAMIFAAKAEQEVISLSEDDYFFCDDFAEEDKQERPNWNRFLGERYRFASEVIDHTFRIASDEEEKEAVKSINYAIRAHR